MQFFKNSLKLQQTLAEDVYYFSWHVDLLSYDMELKSPQQITKQSFLA